MLKLPFQDRTEAGRLLGAEVASRGFANPIVLALLRGGLPVGVEVADALHAPLDILVVRKIGVPWQPELAMGAMAGPTPVLDYELMDALQISPRDVESIIAAERAEMQRCEKLYRGELPPPDLRGRTVVLVDDGLATGSTMVAACRQVRTLQPRGVIVAVPVGSAEACKRLGEATDQCICLATPESFHAVGEWYVDFRQVTDDEVQEIVRRRILEPVRSVSALTTDHSEDPEPGA